MDRDDLINILYNFIVDRFNQYYWKSASKYKYSSTDFAQYDSYNDFCLTQEIILYGKSYQELVFLISIKNMIEDDGINIMESRYMLPKLGYGILFNNDGKLIIYNKK